MHNHSHTIHEDMFVPVGQGTTQKFNITVDELIRMRNNAFDRWCWESGDIEDKKLFERLDGILSLVKQSIASSMISDSTYEMVFDTNQKV